MHNRNVLYIIYSHKRTGKENNADTRLEERRQEKHMVDWP
jgi:hypothetical protein